MKKKIALLLAAVMTVAAPMTAFANPNIAATTKTSDAPVNTLFTPHYTGVGDTAKQDNILRADANNPVDALGPAKDVRIRLNNNDSVESGSTFTLNVSNALIKFYDSTSTSDANINGRTNSFVSGTGRGRWTVVGGSTQRESSGGSLVSYTSGLRALGNTFTQNATVTYTPETFVNPGYTPVAPGDLEAAITIADATYVSLTAQVAGTDAVTLASIAGNRYFSLETGVGNADGVKNPAGIYYSPNDDGAVADAIDLTSVAVTLWKLPAPTPATTAAPASYSFTLASAGGNIGLTNQAALTVTDGDAWFDAIDALGLNDGDVVTINTDVIVDITSISNNTGSSSFSARITYEPRIRGILLPATGLRMVNNPGDPGDDVELLEINIPVQTTSNGDVKWTVGSYSAGFSSILTGDPTIASVPTNAGRTTLTVNPARESRTGFVIESLTISETTHDVIQAASGSGVTDINNVPAFTLTLSDGAVFADQAITAFFNAGNAQINHVGFSRDMKTAYFTMTGTLTRNILTKIVFNNISVEYNNTGKTPEQKQNVNVTVESIPANSNNSYRTLCYAPGTNGSNNTVDERRILVTRDAGITTATVKVGEFRDYGVHFGFTSTTSKIVTPYSGEADVIVPNITLVENTADSWNSHRTTRFSLTDEEGNVLDGVKIKSIQFYTRNNLTWPATTALFESDSQVGVANHYTFNRSFFEIKDLTSQDNRYGSELEMKLVLNVSGNYVGPVYITVDGNAIVDETEWNVNPFQIADVQAPIAIETKTTEVSIGFQTYDTADVKVTEADKNILKANGTVTLSIAEFAESTNYYSLANNVTFNPITLDDVKVEAVAKNKQATVFNKVSVNNNSVSLNVSKTSTEATTFTVSGLKVNINRSVPYGNFDLVVGGTSFIKTYYGNLVTTNTISSDAIERSSLFAVAGVVSEDYIRVITKSVYKSMEMNILLTEDNQIGLVETKEVDMGIAPYINDAGRMMIPLRALSGLFNIDKENIIWDEATSTVTIVLGDRIVSFTKDSSIMKVNGVDVPMQDAKGTTTAEIHPVYERFFIPVKPLSTAFDVPVQWDAATKTAYLNPTPAQLVEVFGLTVDSTGTVVAN